VVLSVQLCSFSGMVSSVMKMPLCGVRVVRRRFPIIGVVVLGSFPMVPCRVFVVLGSLTVMLCSFSGHWRSSSFYLMVGRRWGILQSREPAAANLSGVRP